MLAARQRVRLFRAAEAGTAGRAGTALRHLLPLVAAALAVLGVYLLLDLWAAYSSQPAFRIASELTLKLRRPVRPSAVLDVFNFVLWLVRWVVVPVLCLPMIAGAATEGWRRLGSFGARSRKALYWVETPVLLLCALWVPAKLYGWVPRAGGFAFDLTSLALRVLIGYLLFVGAWLLLVFLTSSEDRRPPSPRLRFRRSG